MNRMEELFSGLPDYKNKAIGTDGDFPLLPRNLWLYFRDGGAHRAKDCIFCHEAYIMIYVFEGSRELQMDDCTFFLKKDDIIIIPPYARHRSFNASADLKVVMASFELPDDDDRLLGICGTPFKLNRRARKYLFESCKSFLSWYHDDLPCANEVICLFGIFLNRLINANLSEFINEQLHPDDELVSRVVEYLAVHRDHHVTLRELSHVLHRSGSIIRQVFKKKTGRSLGHYELVERLRVGIRLLNSTDLSISAISEKIGFKSPKGVLAAVKRECHGATLRDIRQKKR